MKRKLLLLFLFGCSWIISQAQTFNKRFGFDGVGTMCYAVELRDTFIFVAGIIADTTVNSGIKSVLAKFDYNGNLISKNTFRPQGYPQYVSVLDNSMITTSDNGIAVTGYAGDSLGKLLLSFTKYDSAGLLQFYKIIAPAIPGYRTIDGHRIIEYPNKGYYLAGDIQLSNYTVKPFLCQLDITGNLVFFKTYSTNTFYDGTRGMVILPDSSIGISISSSENNPDTWLNIGYTRLYKIDTSGLLIHPYSYGDSNTSVGYHLSLTMDSNYLSSGNYFALRQQGEGFQMQHCIVKWDTSFNPTWSYRMGTPYAFNLFNDFEQTPSSDIVLCGYEVCGVPCGSGLSGKLTKLDKDGNLIWNRNYKGLNSTMWPNEDYNYLYDIDLMPNGDIIAIGTCEGNATLQYSWLLRVNSVGCMDDGSCDYTDIEEHTAAPSTEPIRVYPNPSNGIFTIYAQADLPPAACITVFDINGKQLLRQPFFNQANLLNLHHLSKGIYFYEIGNGLVKAYSGKLIKE